MLTRYPHAFIRDIQLDRDRLFPFCHAWNYASGHTDRAALRGILDCIIHKIRQYLVHLVRVGSDQWKVSWKAHRQLVVACIGPLSRQNFLGCLDYVDLGPVHLHRSALLNA